MEGVLLGLPVRVNMRRILGLPAARVLLGIISFATSVLMVRALGPVEFGHYSAGMALATVVAVLGPWGLDQLQIFHGLGEGEATWASRRVAAFTLGVGLVVAAVWPSLDMPSRLCAAAGVLGFAARILVGPWLTGSLKRLDIGVRVRSEFLTLALSGVVGLAVAGATRSALASLSGSALYLLIVAGARAGRSARPAVRRQAFRSIVRRGVPYALSSAAYTLYFSVDAAILATFRREFEVGQYRAAYMLFAAVLVVPIALNNDLLRSHLARDEGGDRRRTIARFGLLTVSLSVAAFGAVAALHVMIVGKAYGNGYGAAASLLGVLSLAIIPAYANSWLSNALVGLMRIRVVVAVQAVLTVMNVAANLAVIPRYGARGAAWSTVCTESAAVAIFGFFLLRAARESLVRCDREG